MYGLHVDLFDRRRRFQKRRPLPLPLADRLRIRRNPYWTNEETRSLVPYRTVQRDCFRYFHRRAEALPSNYHRLAHSSRLACLHRLVPVIDRILIEICRPGLLLPDELRQLPLGYSTEPVVLNLIVSVSPAENGIPVWKSAIDLKDLRERFGLLQNDLKCIHAILVILSLSILNELHEMLNKE